MCHPEVPAGMPIPDVATREAPVTLSTGEQLPGLLALPARTPAPAILIMNDIFGRSPFYENLARRIAQAGFVGYTPEIFFRQGPLAERTLDAARERRGRLDEPRTLKDYDEALNWLAAQPEVAGNPVGIVGFCMGGTYVLNFAALRPDLAAGVCYYGFPAAGGAAPRPIDQAAAMQIPLLGFWGDQDAGVGMDNVEALRAALVREGKQHEFHIYPGIGHGFLGAALDTAGAPGYDEACESWGRAITFYREHLRELAAV